MENSSSSKGIDDKGSKYLTIAKLQVGQKGDCEEDGAEKEVSFKVLRLKGKSDEEEIKPSWWNAPSAEVTLRAMEVLRKKKEKAQ